MLRSIRKALATLTAGRLLPTRRGGKRGFARHRRLLRETLEPRIVLDAGPLITEFMAVNDSTLADEDGDSSDWIEIYNPTDQSVDLGGWYLTDEVNDLPQWQFPAVTLDAQQYRVVFASGKNRRDPAGELHTNFKLSGGGEYLALVEPNGVTVAHEYAPEFPEQVEDFSYGLGAPAPIFQTLVAAGAQARYHVPTAGEDVLAWTAPDYDDATWIAPATTGVGFSDNNPDFDDIIGTDVESDMLGVNASLWVRMEIQAADPSVFDQLTLRMKYDDGFVAYLNGAEVARRNAPEAPDTLEYDSAAREPHDDADAVVYEDIDMSDYLPLLQAGTNVLAIHGLNAAAADADFLILPEVTAEHNPESPRYMVTATPGQANAAGSLGFVDDTRFSLDRGFYDTPQVVAIYTDTDGATIMYTLDGSAPSETHGTAYTGPITIDTTTTLRALAFKPGHQPSNVDTQTYIFLDDVIHQDGEGLPDTWGEFVRWNVGQLRPADYEMSPSIVNDPRYVDTIKDDLRSIPTMSLAMNPDDLWDHDTGIYSNSFDQGIAWERAASVELIDTDGSTLFQVDSGIRIHGGWGRYPYQNSKHSFRLLFKSDYGPTKLDYPLFADDAPDADDSFDTLVLRAGFNDQWRGTNPTYIQDRWTAEVQNRNGGYAPHGAWVHLYINGLYWGLYNPVERPNADFAASYFGGNKEDYDAYRTGGLIDGDSAAWNQMFSLVRAPAIDYAAVSQMLDIPAFIDYMVINQFGGNWDWPHNNWYASRYRDNGKWYFHSWDAEGCISNLTGNRVNNFGNNSSGEIYQRLRGDGTPSMPGVEEFRVAYADRVHRLLFNDGLLTPDANLDTLNSIVEVIDRAIVGESARWGDGRKHAPHAEKTRDDWLARINWLRDTYFPQRTGIVLGQFRTAGLYPDIEAPTYSQHGGHIAPTDTVTVSAPAGTIYYTLDGTDPRLEGGALNPAAVPITTGSAIPLSESAVVKTRALDGGSEWSALNEATFVVDDPSGVRKLVLTEINYNPYDPTTAELAVNPAFTAGDFEFVELQYQGADPITLAGAQFVDGITFDFATAPPVTVDPGGYVVVVSNPQAFAARYDTAGMTVFGPFTGSLSNGGEQITLVDSVGEPIVDFEYNDSGNWPGRADGRGSSLNVIDTGGDYNYSENWRSSTEVGGSPGAAATDRVVDVIINEVLSHTDLPDLDAIELHNPTDDGVNIGGWYLTDSSSNFWKFQIPGGTTISAGEYLFFDESDFNSSGGVDPNDFALSGAHGDEVRLLAADLPGKLRFADHVEFGASKNGESFGRWPDAIGDLYPMISTTLGRANSGPRVGPVIISEVMYHPPAPSPEALAIYPALTEGDLQFIEIYNPTMSAVNLTDWRIRQGIDFDFAPGTMLGSDEAIAIISFNPETTDAAGELVNADRIAAFRNHYGIAASAWLVGPFSGELDNGGERVQLQRPDEPPLEEPEFIPRLVEDEVLYDDVEPWPLEADGVGLSLNRDRPARWGHDAASWVATSATPGDASLKMLVVSSLTATVRGFVVEFDRELKPDALNLYDAQNGTLGPADVTLVGNSVGPISGSLFFGTHSVSFISSGDPLPADTYTVTLRSGKDAFHGLTVGELLDGNNDGTSGDDYVGFFTVDTPPPVVVSLADFMRGPGQPVDLPATEPGLPFRLSEADGVESVDLFMIFNPDLLNITNISVGAGMPDGADARINRQLPDGRIWMSFTSPTPLPAGPAEFMRLEADVPADAPYGESHVLKIEFARINAGAIVPPLYGAVHTVGYLGDTTGNQSYSGLDAQRAARVAVELDSGFAAYPNVDPVIIADATGNGQLSGLDAQRIALEAVGLDADEIPPLPQPLRLAAPASRSGSVTARPCGRIERRTVGVSPLVGPDNGSQYQRANARRSPKCVQAPGCGLNDVAHLSAEQLAPVVDATVTRIESVAPDAAAKLEDVQFEIVDLPDNLLGLAVGNSIRIDVDAAGYGWFVQKDKGQSAKDKGGSAKDEAVLTVPHSEFRTANSVDLLTVVMHEMGHVLGLDHHDSGLMDDTLTLGTRRLWGDELDSLSTELVADAVGNPPAPNIEAIDEVFRNQI